MQGSGSVERAHAGFVYLCLITKCLSFLVHARRAHLFLEREGSLAPGVGETLSGLEKEFWLRTQ